MVKEWESLIKSDILKITALLLMMSLLCADVPMSSVRCRAKKHKDCLIKLFLEAKMRTYGKRKILFTTSIEEDKLIVDVLTENKDFRRFLKTNANNGPYLVRWYKEKKDRFETFEKEKCRSDFQVFSQAHSFFGLLIKDNIECFNQNKVEYRGIKDPKKR